MLRVEDARMRNTVVKIVLGVMGRPEWVVAAVVVAAAATATTTGTDLKPGM